jgi:hypothetical protein
MAAGISLAAAEASCGPVPAGFTPVSRAVSRRFHASQPGRFRGSKSFATAPVMIHSSSRSVSAPAHSNSRRFANRGSSRSRPSSESHTVSHHVPGTAPAPVMIHSSSRSVSAPAHSNSRRFANRGSSRSRPSSESHTVSHHVPGTAPPRHVTRDDT